MHIEKLHSNNKNLQTWKLVNVQRENKLCLQKEMEYEKRLIIGIIVGKYNWTDHHEVPNGKFFSLWSLLYRHIALGLN